MTKYPPILLLISCILLLASCEQPIDKLGAYYYPLDKLKKPKIYEYAAVDDEQLPPFHWVYQTEEKDGRTFFKGEYFDHNAALKQVVVEEKKADRIIAVSYELVETDSLGKTQRTTFEITDNDVYPLGSHENPKILKFTTKWTDPLETTMHNELRRGRIFQQFTTYNYHGKDLPCAEFLMVETIEVEKEGEGMQTLELETRELFAKGLGLIYYNKTVGENEMAYELKKIRDLGGVDFSR